MPKLPTINIKGSEYTLVKDRILEFNRLYPDGCIQTEILSPIESQLIVVKATIYPDKLERKFTGHSQAVIGEGYINKTSALENAETSAVGRALAMMGIGVIDSIASIDEINKATNREKFFSDTANKSVRIISDEKNPTKSEIKRLCDNLEPLLSTSEDYRNFVLKQTKMELSTDNYQEIIDRLKILNSEACLT